MGIGTTNPTAELEIVTSNGGIPALEINPQTAPTGTVTGQVSLIGDKLYMYDATRTKWLSLETPILQFGRSGNQDNTPLRSAGNVGNNNSGILMPFDGTITCVTAKTNSNNGAQAKQFTIRVRNGISNVSTMNITTAASLYTNTTCNLDFSAGDYINAVIANDGNGNVHSSTIALWIKWRQ
ncbi:hypothetical protein GCM10022396_37720 [Flavivirga amylovorans]